MTHRVGIDIGGTFTDFVLLDDDHGDIHVHKRLTTPDDPAIAVLEGLDQLLAEAQITISSVQSIIHGSTLVTNAVIERRGATVGMLVTNGFIDVLDIALEQRYDLYQLDIRYPTPLVPRNQRREVNERIRHDGSMEIELNLDEVRRMVDELLSRHQIEALAVCLLQSFINPDHENKIRELIDTHYPGLFVSTSASVLPYAREYERWTSTVINAFTQPLVDRYLNNIEHGLKRRGLDGSLYIMTSSGGTVTPATARRFPVRMLESGPAAGVLISAHHGRRLGIPDVLSFDMGGTTAKICLIDAAVPQFSRAFEVDRRYRFKKGSGLPVRIPVIEMVEIGAGGGSIASVDNLNRVRVGPKSAGSEPGPACYGIGGQEATVTDADVVMGRMDESRFASGHIHLDVDAAAVAVKKSVGDALDLDLVRAAYAISEIVNENMATAARGHASEWGKALIGRTLIAFGGAAPLHAARLASKLGIDRVIIPPAASVGSAIGFLIAPISYEVVRSRYMRLSAFDEQLIDAVMVEMREEATTVVSSAAQGRRVIETARAYMRYVGQGYEISVEFDPTFTKNELIEAFEGSYTELYGRIIPGLDVEVLSWTLNLTTAQEQAVPIDETLPRSSNDKDYPTRLMVDDGNLVPAQQVFRDQLPKYERLEGPMLIIEDQTTTVVPSRFAVHVNAREDLVIEKAK